MILLTTNLSYLTLFICQVTGGGQPASRDDEEDDDARTDIPVEDNKIRYYF